MKNGNQPNQVQQQVEKGWNELRHQQVQKFGNNQRVKRYANSHGEFGSDNGGWAPKDGDQGGAQYGPGGKKGKSWQDHSWHNQEHHDSWEGGKQNNGWQNKNWHNEGHGHDWQKGGPKHDWQKDGHDDWKKGGQKHDDWKKGGQKHDDWQNGGHNSHNDWNNQQKDNKPWDHRKGSDRWDKKRPDNDWGNEKGWGHRDANKPWGREKRSASRSDPSCDGIWKSPKNATVELYEYDAVGKNDHLATVKADASGNFLIAGEESELLDIQPFLVINYDCGEETKPRCEKYEISEHYINSHLQLDRHYKPFETDTYQQC
jgi:hypothetical protein